MSSGSPGPSSRISMVARPAVASAPTVTVCAPACAALRKRLDSARKTCPRSAKIVRSPAISPTNEVPGYSAPCSAASSSTSSLRKKCSALRVAFESRAKSRVWVHRRTARSIERTRVGAIRLTPGSSLPASRSETSCAAASMLRRSWLIRVIAAPSAARRSFWRRVVSRFRCRWAYSSCASPISSRRPVGGSMPASSIGSSLNRTILSVRRWTGRTISQCRVRNTSKAVKKEMISERIRMRCEYSSMPWRSAASEISTSRAVAGSRGDGPTTRSTSPPPPASVAMASQISRRKSGLPRLTRLVTLGGMPAVIRCRDPSARRCTTASARACDSSRRLRSGLTILSGAASSARVARCASDRTFSRYICR